VPLPGPKPKGKVEIKWSPDFAYTIGLIASDGCLSSNGRHISFVSKEKEQIDNFLKGLRINVKIGTTYSGWKGMKAYRVQFGDVLFYEFLNSIGLTKAKSKTMGALYIPDEFFFDFLRGLFDGDGCTYSYWDPRWRSSFMMYISFASASLAFILWLQNEIKEKIDVTGHISAQKDKPFFQLRYAKKDCQAVIKCMYKTTSKLFLTRKYLKILASLDIVQQQVNPNLTK
jgi:hypothetical protein